MAARSFSRLTTIEPPSEPGESSRCRPEGSLRRLAAFLDALADRERTTLRWETLRFAAPYRKTLPTPRHHQSKLVLPSVAVSRGSRDHSWQERCGESRPRRTLFSRDCDSPRSTPRI